MNSYQILIPYNGMSIDECAWRARNAITRLGWRNPREVPGAMFASVPLSFFSWGEDFAVYFSQEGMRVESKSSYPLTLIDWGKNRKNVNAFMAAFNSQPMSY